jgi:hypothetical protein
MSLSISATQWVIGGQSSKTTKNVKKWYIFSKNSAEI